MADFDGDGLTEIIQLLQFSREEISEMGYDIDDVDEKDTVQVCRVIKWDGGKKLLVQASENIIVESGKAQGSLSFLNYIDRERAQVDDSEEQSRQS